MEIKMLAKTEIKIEKNVALPSPADRSRKYPFNKLEVGDSFAAPEGVNVETFRNAAWAFAKKRGWTIAVRKTDAGYRCWRTA